MDEKEHEVDLNFVQGNQKTKIACKCGVEVGVVITGTRLSEIMKMFRKHISDG